MAKTKAKAPDEVAEKVIGTNPSLLPWPTDRWGLTKDMKQAFTLIGSRIAGAPDKKALFDEVMAIGMEFIELKYEQDKEARAERLAAQLAAEAEQESE